MDSTKGKLFKIENGTRYNVGYKMLAVFGWKFKVMTSSAEKLMGTFAGI